MFYCPKDQHAKELAAVQAQLLQQNAQLQARSCWHALLAADMPYKLLTCFTAGALATAERAVAGKNGVPNRALETRAWDRIPRAPHWSSQSLRSRQRCEIF
jgi:hypothetical protein